MYFTYPYHGYVAVLLNSCTIWSLAKCSEKKQDRNYTTMNLSVLNKSWKHYLTKRQLYSHILSLIKCNPIKTNKTCRAQLLKYLFLNNASD